MSEGRPRPPESERCRLYLIAPERPQAADLEAALDAADVACLLLVAADLPSEEARSLIQRVQARDVACLVAGDATLAEALGADGVHLAAPADYGVARRQLGSDAIVGVACGRSRHDAMEAGEAGADYVAFTVETAEDLEILRDWSTTTVVPCVAWRTGPVDAGDIAEAGAEFLAVGDIWSDPRGAAAALRACAAALAGRRPPP